MRDRGSDATRVERWMYALAERAETDPRARRVLVGLVNAMFRAVVAERRRGGRRLLNLARASSVRWGRWRAQRLRERLHLDVNDMSDMGRLQDWEDRAFGVTGHWTEQGKTRAVKCETGCPFAKVAAGAPELCTDVVHALEEATFRELNPRYRLLPLERLLSKGAPACEFVHVLETPAGASTWGYFFGARRTRMRRSTSSHIVRRASPGDRQDCASSSDSGVVPSTNPRIEVAR